MAKVKGTVSLTGWPAPLIAAAQVMHIGILALWLALPCHAQAFEQYNRIVKYDRYFSKYAKRFFGPAFAWTYFKAQAVAESSLDATAQSRVGAAGIMQIMPKTYQELRRKSPFIKGSAKQPRWNIAAGIYYDRLLWNTWKARRPLQDRINFMFASFNAGKGNILKAQNIAKEKGLDHNLWRSVERTLPHVTGRHSQETIGYVRKIKTIQKVLK